MFEVSLLVSASPSFFLASDLGKIHFLLHDGNFPGPDGSGAAPEQDAPSTSLHCWGHVFMLVCSSVFLPYVMWCVLPKPSSRIMACQCGVWRVMSSSEVYPTVDIQPVQCVVCGSLVNRGVNELIEHSPATEPNCGLMDL